MNRAGRTSSHCGNCELGSGVSSRSSFEIDCNAMQLRTLFFVLTAVFSVSPYAQARGFQPPAFEAQLYLSVLGFYPERPDGICGPNTTRALARFLVDHPTDSAAATCDPRALRNASLALGAKLTADRENCRRAEIAAAERQKAEKGARDNEAAEKAIRTKETADIKSGLEHLEDLIANNHTKMWTAFSIAGLVASFAVLASSILLGALVFYFQSIRHQSTIGAGVNAVASGGGGANVGQTKLDLPTKPEDSSAGSDATAAMVAEKYADLYRIYRGYIMEESGLINSRLMWIITINGFLYTTFGLVLTKQMEIYSTINVNKQSIGSFSYTMLHSYIFSLVVCLVGIFIGIYGLKSVIAAQNASTQVADLFESNLTTAHTVLRNPDRPDGIVHAYKTSDGRVFPHIRGGGNPGNIRNGHVPSRRIPLFFLLSWIFSLALSCYMLFLH